MKVKAGDGIRHGDRLAEPSALVKKFRARKSAPAHALHMFGF
jgi:hypothetical protein